MFEKCVILINMWYAFIFLLISGLRDIICWLHSQLGGRPLTCIHWLLKSLRYVPKVSFFYLSETFKAYELISLYVIFCFVFFFLPKTTICSLSNNKFNFDLAQGSYVYDINGKKYLDALAGLWSTALGIEDVL